MMQGREDKRENDLFFACSIIEYIGRKTKNKRSDVVAWLGKSEISHLYELADVLHSVALENTASELIGKHLIVEGGFDNVSQCCYQIPTHFDIAKVYKRLIASVADAQNIAVVDALILVYSSWISDKIDDYNSSMYFENPDYLYQSYLAGMAIE